jgi:pimeloyl-ACP methyl ester carboxylesterase
VRRAGTRCPTTPFGNGSISARCTDRSLVSPDGYTLDIAYMHRPEAKEIQLDLVLSYRTNVALYPQFQEYFRKSQVPLLAVWGKNDPFFLPPGAEAYKRDLPNAEIHFLDAGHFALETHSAEIAELILAFLDRTHSPLAEAEWSPRRT